MGLPRSTRCSTPALVFDGVGDYAPIADPDGADNLDGFDAITLAAWVNPDGLQMVDGCCGGIVTKYESGARVSWGLDI